MTTKVVIAGLGTTAIVAGGHLVKNPDSYEMGTYISSSQPQEVEIGKREIRPRTESCPIKCP